MSRFVWVTVALGAALAPSAALAQAGIQQPDRLPLGTVHVGATVEASLVVFENAADPAKVALAVEAPSFVKVLDKSVIARDFRDANNNLVKGVGGVVTIAIDTAKPGTFDGEVKVKLGTKTAKVPVSVVVKPPAPAAVRVLVVESPFHWTATDDASVFKDWTDLVADAGWDVSYLNVTPGKPALRDLDLSKFGVVLLDGGGLFDLTAADLKQVRAFAEAGGRLVLAANHFFVGSVEKANKVLDGYGLKMVDAEATGAAAEVIVDTEAFGPELIKAGIKSARFYRASPVAVTDAKRGRVLVKAAWVGGKDDGFVAIARAGKGEVVALGESLWWNWISTPQAKGTDNAKLLRWLLTPPGGAK
jgi:hypothetical protein